MGLFSKNEEVPVIPSAPTLPELPTLKKEEQEKKDLPELPSFPPNSKNENFNQEMVKSAVGDAPSPEEKEVHMEIPKNLHIVEEPKEESMIPPRPSIENTIPEPPRHMSITDVPQKRTLGMPTPTPTLAPTPTPTRSTPKQTEPIFVRIDKFQSSQKNFDQIKSKVSEIEFVLKKIKDVKSQEENELKGWTEDIEKIKSRLAEIDADIFNQI